MKEMVKEEQKINLINCEKILTSESLQKNSSQIRCNIPVRITFSDKRPQVVSIHQTETFVRIKQAK